MNKLIVVTGGSKGIGRSIIERFMAAGFDAVACARKPDDLKRLETETTPKFKEAKLYTYTADLAQPEQVSEFAAFITSLNRSITVLVNNAGYFVPGSLADEPEGTLERMMDANLFSAYRLTRSLLPTLKQQGHGHIFNMCSVASIKAYANGGSYAVTKFALLGFSKCLREELKPWNIRVTAVMPGATLTASWKGTHLPEERFMRTEDVADIVYACWAVSERSVVEEILIRPLQGDI